MANFFIRRPIVAIVIAIVTVIIGGITIALLPIAQFPNIAPPEIWLQANYPGADAKTLEQSVATPIEQQVTGVDNMEYMYSVNTTNGSQTSLLVDFDLKTDPNMDLILTRLRKNEIHVGISLEIKIDEQRGLRTIGGVYGIHVFHIVDAGDLLFDRSSYGLLQSLRVGTRVVSLQPDFRWGNVRKLCDWQKRNRDPANDDGNDRDHNRDYGASDEKVRHDLTLLRFRVRRGIYQLTLFCLLRTDRHDSFSRLQAGCDYPKR